MKIKILLKEIRAEKGYSLEKLSQLTGISKSHLNYIEKNEKEPSLSIAIRIAQALNIDIKELYEVIKWLYESAKIIYENEIKSFHIRKVAFRIISTIVDEFCYIYTAEASEKEKRRNEVMNVVENEIMKELNWKEKIIVKVFAKTFKKVYNVSRINSINALIK